MKYFPSFPQIFIFSLLHRRRLRRWPDHGHDRFEVPAHRGNTFCEMMMMQSAGEKEMDSQNLLSFYLALFCFRLRAFKASLSL